MNQEAILQEAVLLAGDILHSGAQDSRGVRLAALVLKLNEAMNKGDVPLSWRPPAPPRISREVEAVQAVPDETELDRVWDNVFPSIPSSFPKAPAHITTSPKPRITLAPPDDQPEIEVVELNDEDVEIIG